jgi:hypothetical protein
MWWVIGIAVAGLVAFLAVKFQAHKRHVELVTAAQSQLRMSFWRYSFDAREIDPRVWRDAYLLGYATGTISIMVKVYGGKLTQLQRGMVTVDTFKGVVGNAYGLVLEEISRLQAADDPEFGLGADHGMNVSILMANIPTATLLADPDVQAAMREVPAAERATAQGTGETNVTPYAMAGGMLMRRYMSDHFLD